MNLLYLENLEDLTDPMSSERRVGEASFLRPWTKDLRR